MLVTASENKTELGNLVDFASKRCPTHPIFQKLNTTTQQPVLTGLSSQRRIDSGDA
jgi:hypothetical protein